MQRLKKFWQHTKAWARPRPLRFAKHGGREGMVLAVVFVGAIVIWPTVTHAQVLSTIGNGLAQILTWFLMLLQGVLGSLLVSFIDILVWIAQYNDFINAPAVQTGWAVTRDVANMFFIVALLLISIGTVFRIQEYHYSSMLRKLIMMAILINFSKTIAAFFIDLSQVVMLTFVNAFKDMAAGNLTQGFGLDKLVSFARSASPEAGDINHLSILGAVFVSVIMLFIALIVVAIFVILLAQRIVMLWIYIVLAPTAYMVAVLPGSLGSWWSSWWRDFTQYLIKGPVIAFFLWLALTIISLSSTTILNAPTDLQQGSGGLGASAITNANSQAAFASEATTTASIINYIIAVGMLVAGLQQATKASGVAGNVASKWMGNINRWGGNLALSPLRGVKSLAKTTLERPGYAAGSAALGAGAAIFSTPLLAWTGLGKQFGKTQAKLNRQRLKSEEKDSDWINYADESTRQRMATSRIQLTEGGRRDSKIARENLIKNNQFRGLSADQRAQVINSYRGDIGHRMGRDAAGNYYETAVDAPGQKILRDFLTKKSPASMESDLRAARASGNHRLEAYWREQMERSVDRMTVGDFNEMDAGDWDTARNPIFNSIAIPRLAARAARNADFQRKMRSDVSAANLSAINGSYAASVGIPGAILFKGGKKRAATEKEETRAARIEERERKIHDISGLRKFVDGKSADFGVDANFLAEQGIPDVSGGFVRDPQAVRALSEGMKEALQNDIKYIEENISDLQGLEPDVALKDFEGNSVKDATGKVVTVGEQRNAYQAELDLKREALDKFSQPRGPENIAFYNRDQHPTLSDAKNSIAHENVHRSLQEMDPEGKFRAELLDSAFSDKERAEILERMEQKTGRYLSYKEAFEEYLTEGLVNQGRYADKEPDAVKLKDGLGIQIKRQAEKTGKQMKYVGMEQLPETAESKRVKELEASKAQLATMQQQNQAAKAAAAAPRTRLMGTITQQNVAATTKAVEAQQKKVSALEAKVLAEQPKKPEAPKVKPLISKIPFQAKPGIVDRQAIQEEPETPANITNITNINQEVKQAFQRVPETYDKLKSITPEVLNNALKNTIVWQGLMKYVKNIAAEVEESSKQAGVNTEGLQKEFSNRLGKMDSHLQAGNAEEFKEEFASLQNLAGGSDSSTGDSYSEAA